MDHTDLIMLFFLCRYIHEMSGCILLIYFLVICKYPFGLYSSNFFHLYCLFVFVELLLTACLFWILS